MNDQRKDRYARDPALRERVKATSARSRAKRRDHYLAKQREWHDANREQANRLNRERTLRRRYGIEPEDYDRILKAQRGVCAICKGDDQHGRMLAVDHCHATGRVRGLLCDFCNRATGLLRDDPTVASAMARYLRKK